MKKNKQIANMYVIVLDNSTLVSIARRPIYLYNILPNDV
jgi:hypothetical protein